ncbi:TonB-dependent siderophore receptor [Methyloferula stellata]|uniref:TonB-dependent siderophore receptor n=1 Tax=Methyloferula stellata TaxID=876270 RepID=UPI0003698B0C|nr:TonB-dependent receptor plug domain-containing protein [Methyloferula stellata]
MASAYAQQATTPIPDVSVNAPAPVKNDGSAAAGYRVDDSTATGPFWGDLPLQDAPYSINVIPAEQIQNMQVYSLQDALKYDPDIQFSNNNHNDGTASSYKIRGFSLGGNYGQGVTLEGLQSSMGVNPALEDKQQIEVLDGVNGFLYGVQQVGGNINTVLKRPTAVPYFAIEGGDNAGSNGYGHLDIGGPLKVPGLDESVFGYRLNLVDQAGGTNLKNQSLKRSLESGAIDIHLPDDMLLQFNASHSNYHLWGLNQLFLGVGSPNGNYISMPPLDPSSYITDPQATWMEDNITAGTKFTWKLNDTFTFRSEYQYGQDQVYGNAHPYNSVTNQATGAMTVLDLAGAGESTTYTHAGYAFLDTSFSTFDINHKVTTGFNGDTYEATRGPLQSAKVTGSAGPLCNYYAQYLCNYGAILATPVAPQANAGPFYWSYAKNYMIGDELKMFGDKLIVLAGANYAQTGTFQPKGYQSAALTPAVAIVYKILPWLSTYASFQQSLQGGGVVPATDGSGHAFTNVGATIPPYMGTQVEVGVKATVGTNLLVTADVFRIDQPAIYTQLNGDGTATDEVGGSQLDQGVEFKVTGKLWDDLTLVGGATLMDPRLNYEPAAPYQQGELPAYVSPLEGKLYAEYNIPYFAEAPWAHNIILTGGLTYTGPFHANVPSQTSQIAITKINGYTTGDLGFRYVTKLYDHQLTMRFTCTNVTNHAYWAESGYWGQPRTYLATAEFKW